MKTNAHFIQGRGHDICEDYCISGTIHDYSYVIGSDGCSSSSGTDFGSRILCHGARASLSAADPGHISSLTVHELEMFLRQEMVQHLQKARSSFHLNRSPLDATLIILLAEKNRVRYFFWGDGTLIIRRTSGIEVITLEYASGAPRYLSYDLAPGDNEAYLQKFSSTPLFLERKSIFSDHPGTAEKNNLPGLHYYGELSVQELNDVLTIAVTSDGINTFGDSEGRIILPEQAAEELTDFKSTAGDFMVRRMKKIERLYGQQGITHYDDLFCGAVILDRQEAGHENIH